MKQPPQKKRYNRIAPLYDAMEWFAERAAFQGWRKALWARMPGRRVLEVGVGTGKNLDYHPAQAHITAIDLSNNMLARARKKAKQTGRSIDLREMDVQQLEFADNSFDAAAAGHLPDTVAKESPGQQRAGHAS